MLFFSVLRLRVLVAFLNVFFQNLFPPPMISIPPSTRAYFFIPFFFRNLVAEVRLTVFTFLYFKVNEAVTSLPQREQRVPGRVKFVATE